MYQFDFIIVQLLQIFRDSICWISPHEQFWPFVVTIPSPRFFGHSLQGQENTTRPLSCFVIFAPNNIIFENIFFVKVIRFDGLQITRETAEINSRNNWAWMSAKKERKVSWLTTKMGGERQTIWRNLLGSSKNVKLRFVWDTVEIFEFFCDSAFTWNQYGKIGSLKDCNFDNFGDSEFWF